MASNLPADLFIFVDRLVPMTRWNLETVGSFTSASWPMFAGDPDFASKHDRGAVDYQFLVPNTERSHGFVSPYARTAVTDYMLEYNAEEVRRREFPTCPSRLSAVFAFGDWESCEHVNAKYCWDDSSVQKFHLQPSPNRRGASKYGGSQPHAPRLSPRRHSRRRK
jgi:hypothetical protein